MKNQEAIDRFIQLRCQGWSYSKIMVEMSVCRQTLVNWSRKYQFEIQNARTIQMEALQHQLLATSVDRARALADRLRKVEAELAKRDLSTVSTARLYAMADTLRDQILRETGPVQFSMAVRDIPGDELCERAHDWKA